MHECKHNTGATLLTKRGKRQKSFLSCDLKAEGIGSNRASAKAQGREDLV